MSDHGHDLDPRYQAGVDFIIAADTYSRAVFATSHSTTVPDKIIGCAQLILFDTMPGCMYKDALAEAIISVYSPEDRAEIVDMAMRSAVTEMGDKEPSGDQRIQLASWLRKIREG